MFQIPLRRHFVAVCAALSIGALVAGCGSDAATSASSVEGSTTVAVAPTVAAATTTVASTVPATTVPAPTTTAVPEPLVLREDGLGPIDFGAAPTDVVDAITAQLGAAASDKFVTYDNASEFEDGLYESSVAPYYVFAFPAARVVCWTGDFCAEFGGSSATELTFTGWSYTGPANMLASSSNLTIGAKWSDFSSMEVNPMCPTDGGGDHHGINVGLDVAGGWDWLIDDGNGGEVWNLPDPAATRVDFLSAGQIHHFYEPC